jgi:cellulose synthase/poly-beta-1,6-N-acetylglucosamine synthase-like glycosyltransferase
MTREHLLQASVIIPVYNGAETLGLCLQALAAQTAEAGSYEVIVIDDGSQDESAVVAERYGVRVIRQARGGAALARNRGAEQARGSILLFTDADCEPERDWIKRMLAPFADPEVVGARGVYRTRQRSAVARFAQAEYEEKYARLARRARVDFVDTYSAAYRREVFWAHGGFDPAFTLDEDQELSYRLARAGHRLVHTPDAVVYHRHAATVGQYARRKARLGRWKVRVHARHPGKGLQDSYTPWSQKAQMALAPLAVGAAAVAVLRRGSWLPAGTLAGLGLLSALPLMVRAARHGWAVALVGPALVLLRAAALDLGLAWGVLSWGPWRNLKRESQTSLPSPRPPDGQHAG